ncbi:hypothetical protein D3C71_1227540 [compost metagenome]
MRHAQPRGRHRALQPVTQRTVADLVMVLREHHEMVRRQASARLAAAIAVPVDLALPGEPFRQHPGQPRGRRAGEIGVVGFGLAGQQHMQRIVEIVIPLRGVALAQQRGRVVLILHHQVHRVCRAIGVDRFTQRHQERLRMDRVHRIQAQPVKAILAQPHQRIVDEEALHPRLPEVDGRAPRCAHVLAEELRGIGGQLIALGAEVIEHHIQQHHHAQRVGGIDQCLELVGGAIHRGRCIGEHAVIAPVAGAGERGQRHQLQGGDAHRRQGRKLRLQRRVAAHRAYVHLIQHGFGPGPPGAPGGLPGIGVFVGNRAGPLEAFRLPARGRVGNAQRAVDAEPVATARRAGTGHRMTAIVLGHHRHDLAFQQQFHATRRRCP